MGAPTDRTPAPDPSRRRVLLLVTELRPAGAERVVLELATRLDPAAWQVAVASLRSPGGDDGAVAVGLRERGLPVVSLRLRGKLDPAGALRLARLVRRFRPDVLHAHLFHANLAARLLGRPAGARRVVSTVHVVERRRLPARFALERLTAGRDDLTVAVSRAVADFARRRLGADPARLRVVPNGIDLAGYAAAEDPAAARAALDLPADALVLGAVGRLDRQKGLDLLVEAFARLAPDRPEALLVLAGEGPQRAGLEGLARARGVAERVRFLGHRADVPRVLAALDVFCMPSRWEGFGLALAEALAAGRPAVAARVDSLPDVLGDAGVLVPPEDPAALADALAALLGDPARRADLAARAPAQAARFDVERMVADYAALYREALGG